MTNIPTDQRNLPSLLRAAERRVNAHVFRTGGDDSLASIPANLDRDVDLLLMEAAAEIERLRAANAWLEDYVKACDNEVKRAGERKRQWELEPPHCATCACEPLPAQFLTPPDVGGSSG